MKNEEIVLGIDPGSRITGYSVIQNGTKPTVIALGVIKTSSKESFNTRLGIIRTNLDELINTYKPTVLSIEAAFVGINIASALKLAHVRGIVISSAILNNMQVCEYSPRSVKQSVTGSGAAEKEFVRLCIMQALNLANPPTLDASDATALALTYIYKAKNYDL